MAVPSLWWDWNIVCGNVAVLFDNLRSIIMANVEKVKSFLKTIWKILSIPGQFLEVWYTESDSYAWIFWEKWQGNDIESWLDNLILLYYSYRKSEYLDF